MMRERCRASAQRSPRGFHVFFYPPILLPCAIKLEFELNDRTERLYGGKASRPFYYLLDSEDYLLPYLPQRHLLRLVSVTRYFRPDSRDSRDIWPNIVSAESFRAISGIHVCQRVAGRLRVTGAKHRRERTSTSARSPFSMASSGLKYTPSVYDRSMIVKTNSGLSSQTRVLFSPPPPSRAVCSRESELKNPKYRAPSGHELYKQPRSREAFVEFSRLQSFSHTIFMTYARGREIGLRTNRQCSTRGR